MPTLYCPKCGYNLTALTENRCPECGNGFDPQVLLKRQANSVSTRSVVLQLIFVPVGFAVLAPVFMIMTLGGDIAGLILGLAFLFCLIVLHGSILGQSYVNARKLLQGEDNVPWLFRHGWACCILFSALEILLAFMYFAGGCALILSSMSFH